MFKLFKRYLIEIAKIYNIDYEPDPQVIKDEDDEIGRYWEKNIVKHTFDS